MTKFLNTRILLSGATILAAAAVIIGATFAFFSDVETSEANAFTAGDVEVAIGNLIHSYGGNAENAPNYDDDGFSFDLTDIKPLDTGEVSYVLTNNSNDAHVCAMVEEDGNAENIRNGSEQEAGDTTTGNPGTGNGELQNFMSFNFGGQTGLLSEIEGEWFNVGTVLSPGNASFAIGYCFGEYDGSSCIANTNGDVNTAQTDSMTADISFYAVQTRNNEEPFDCATLNDPEVGAALSAYVAPDVQSCDVLVGPGQDNQTIQDGVDEAESEEIVCVEDGDYDETVVISKPLTLASLTGPLASATIESGVNIKSSDVTVTGFVINPGTILGENVAVYLDGGISDVELSYNDLNGLDQAASRGVLTVTSGAYTNVVVANNLIHDFVTGVYTNPGTNSIDVLRNDIYDNSAGIGGFTGAYIAYNEFSSAGEAIGADSSYDGSTVEFNNFLTGTKVNTYVSVTPDIDAPNNWWADGSGTHIGVTNEVDPTPEAVSQYPHQ